MEFSEKLKAARAANGWSQAKCSELIQVPKRTIENWESGARTAPDYVQRLVLEEIERKGKQ